MECSFHLHLNDLETRTAFVANLESLNIDTDTGNELLGGLAHPSCPSRDSARAQLAYGAIMTVCEATVHDQFEVFQSNLGKQGIKVIKDYDEIGFRYVQYIVA